MKRTAHLIAILIITLSAQVGLGGDREHSGKQRHGSPQSGMSASQAAAQARRQTGGRVLSVQPSGSGYRVKVLTDSGKVVSVRISAGR